MRQLDSGRCLTAVLLTRHSSVKLKENNRSLRNVNLLSFFFFFFFGKIGYLVPQAATEKKCCHEHNIRQLQKSGRGCPGSKWLRTSSSNGWRGKLSGRCRQRICRRNGLHLHICCTEFRISCKVARYSALSAGFYISSYAGSGGFQRVHLREHGVCAGNFRANFGRSFSFWCVFVSKLPRGPVAVRQLCLICGWIAAALINPCSTRGWQSSLWIGMVEGEILHPSLLYLFWLKMSITFW